MLIVLCLERLTTATVRILFSKLLIGTNVFALYLSMERIFLVHRRRELNSFMLQLVCCYISGYEKHINESYNGTCFK
jgi:hypothetical protein